MSKAQQVLDLLDEGTNDFSFVLKIEGVPSNLFTLPFGQQIDGLKKIKEFQKIADKDYVDAKGKATMAAVKGWIKDNKPKQYYAKWGADSSSYKDDSVEIYYTGEAK